ncbi:MAG: hypothetical protein MJA31_05165 [Clostridia bacterium]|nr:hypothetical protein [Clostridia bacterium]
MKREGVSAFEITATYIGTIIGAGFASGQEIFQFFVRFGSKELYGLLLTTILFVIYGYMIMRLGRKLNAHSFSHIIQYSSGKYLGRIMDILVSFFLFGALVVMIAGTGALLNQQFHLPYIAGNLIMMVLAIITVLRGIDGIIHSMRFIVPFLLVSVVIISSFSIIKTPPNPDALIVLENNSLIKNWWSAAILYTSYNIIIAIAILGSLGIRAENLSTLKWGAFNGGLGIGVGSMMICLTLLANIHDIKMIEIPMVYVAGKISPQIQGLYAGVLLVAIFTTAVSSLYGTVKRITEYSKFKNKESLIIVLVAIVAFFLSRLGFSNLVKYLYAIEGYVGIILLVGIAYGTYKMKSTD